jgi:exonuclease SbcD
MRFLHTADWHIGKKLHGYDLLEDQQYIIDQIIRLAEEQSVDAIVIAGDLYDRTVPAVDAVKILNEKIAEINLEKKFPLLAISGNHDSPTRLETGSQWFKNTQFYLTTTLEESMKPIEFPDTQFFLLPYFEPIEARLFFDEKITTIAQGVTRVIEEMRKQFDKSKKQVLVTHFFVAGSSHTDSETKVQVGGLDSVPTTAFAGFDYVALGHLHANTALNHERIRYSGSPLKFSLSEITNEKGVYIVDTQKEERTFYPLQPLRDLQHYTASFAELLSPAFYQQIDREAFLHFTLTDRAVIPNMMNQLRRVYPRILSVERQNGRVVKKKSQTIKSDNPQQVIQQFYQEMTGEPLNEQQQKWLIGLSEMTDQTEGSEPSYNQEN